MCGAREAPAPRDSLNFRRASLLSRNEFETGTFTIVFHATSSFTYVSVIYGANFPFKVWKEVLVRGGKRPRRFCTFEQLSVTNRLVRVPRYSPAGHGNCAGHIWTHAQESELRKKVKELEWNGCVASATDRRILIRFLQVSPRYTRPSQTRARKPR